MIAEKEKIFKDLDNSDREVMLKVYALASLMVKSVKSKEKSRNYSELIKDEVLSKRDHMLAVCRLTNMLIIKLVEDENTRKKDLKLVDGMVAILTE